MFTVTYKCCLESVLKVTKKLCIRSQSEELADGITHILPFALLSLCETSAVPSLEMFILSSTNQINFKNINKMRKISNLKAR